jgi:glycosyltransferase involved in cell wall biosynthesis
MINPSFSENFGISVLEGLAYGIPVITTTGTPWEALQREGCGWWISPTRDSLSDALMDATSRSGSDLLEMGRRGQLLAASFKWDKICLQFVSLYQQLIGD